MCLALLRIPWDQIALYVENLQLSRYMIAIRFKVRASTQTYLVVAGSHGREDQTERR